MESENEEEFGERRGREDKKKRGNMKKKRGKGEQEQGSLVK